MKVFKWLLNLWNLFKNARILFLSTRWAKDVQEIANDFTVLQNDILQRKKYTDLKDIDLIAERIKFSNRKTHKLWGEMKKELKVK